jgi:hypothetical protein
LIGGLRFVVRPVKLRAVITLLCMAYQIDLDTLNETPAQR